MGPEICIGCDVPSGSDFVATALGLVGAATGIAGAITGTLAFLASQANHDAEVFREEFSRYRVPIETALQELKRQQITLRASARPVMPIPTLVHNFSAAQRETRNAVSQILSQAEEIDGRDFDAIGWVQSLAPMQSTIETTWEVVADPSQTDSARLQAAIAVVANIDALMLAARGLVDACVKRTLTARRWRRR